MLVTALARVFLLSLLVATPLSSAVIGRSRPAESITAARVATLAVKERAAWKAYLERSRRNGYAWYSAGPQQGLNAYTAWSKEHRP